MVTKKVNRGKVEQNEDFLFSNLIFEEQLQNQVVSAKIVKAYTDFAENVFKGKQLRDGRVLVIVLRNEELGLENIQVIYLPKTNVLRSNSNLFKLFKKYPELYKTPISKWTGKEVECIVTRNKRGFLRLKLKLD